MKKLSKKEIIQMCDWYKKSNPSTTDHITLANTIANWIRNGLVTEEMKKIINNKLNEKSDK